MSDKPVEKRKKARQRKVQPLDFARAYVKNDENATAAFAETRGKRGDISPSYAEKGGSYLLSKPEVQEAIALVKAELEAISMNAVKKVGELIDSDNEVVAGQNARFVIEQVKGKATTHTVNENINIIEAVNSLVLDVEAPEYVEAEVVGN